MLDQKKTGERIAELRKSRNLTQSALAEMLNVTHQAVSKWENGVALPDIEVLLRMRELFGISIDELLDSNPKAETPNPECERATDWEPMMDLIVGPDETREFVSPVDVESCCIKGKALFKAAFHAKLLEASGRAEFEDRIECDTLSQSGQFIAHDSLTADSVGTSGSMTVEREFRSDTLENSGSLTLRDRATADSARNAGSLTIQGDFVVDVVRNAGSFTCQRKLTADSIVNTGSLNCRENCVADTMENMGSMTCGQGLTADDVENRGSLRVEGDLCADALRNDGGLSIEGQVTVDTGELSGRFRISKELTADHLRIMLSGAPCSARTITADSLTVKHNPGAKRATLTVREIHAESVGLSFVDCDSAVASRARIGEGCRIKRLECTEEPEISPDAEVGEVIRG